MPIEWNEETRQFHLHNGGLSYVVAVFANGRAGHLHFGGAVATGRNYRHLGAELVTFDNGAAEGARFEVPTGGGGDFRAPALAIDWRTDRPCWSSSTPATRSSPASSGVRRSRIR